MAKKLLDQARELLRAKHYSYRTEQTYIDWMRRYIFFHNPGLSRGEVTHHPRDMGAPEIQTFLLHLANGRF